MATERERASHIKRFLAEYGSKPEWASWQEWCLFGVGVLITALCLMALFGVIEPAGAQTIEVDPSTAQGVFDAALWQTIGCFTAGNIVGIFIKVTNRS